MQQSGGRAATSLQPPPLGQPGSHTATQPAAVKAGPDQIVDAVLAASRVLVAVAARSIAQAEGDITLPQYRALVVLHSHGPQRTTDLADSLGVNPSTATRMCDRLVRKGWVRRERLAEDRRASRLVLTAAGAALIDTVTRARRVELGRILRRVPAEHRAGIVRSLTALAEAAGEVSDRTWSLGWQE